MKTSPKPKPTGKANRRIQSSDAKDSKPSPGKATESTKSKFSRLSEKASQSGKKNTSGTILQEPGKAEKAAQTADVASPQRVKKVLETEKQPEVAKALTPSKNSRRGTTVERLGTDSPSPEQGRPSKVRKLSTLTSPGKKANSSRSTEQNQSLSGPDAPSQLSIQKANEKPESGISGKVAQVGTPISEGRKTRAAERIARVLASQSPQQPAVAKSSASLGQVAGTATGSPCTETRRTLAAERQARSFGLGYSTQPGGTEQIPLNETPELPQTLTIPSQEKQKEVREQKLLRDDRQNEHNEKRSMEAAEPGQVSEDEVGEMDETEEEAEPGNGGAKKKGRRLSKPAAAMKLSDLDIANEQDMRAALAEVPEKHLEEQARLLDSYAAAFPYWRCQLLCGFNLLFYGFGSKRKLLERFASEALTDGAAVAVNGFLPSVNLKQVLQTLARVVGEQAKKGSKEKPPGPTASTNELLAFLSRQTDPVRVYLLVHNIDGPSLRAPEAQRILATLAACSWLHLAASIDNINAPLLWDKQTANTQFNWWWQHTPTFARYAVEAAFLPPLLVARGSEGNARSAAVVLRSLTPNARGVFRLLADFQLAHPEESGLSFHGWYTLAREKFLVSSEMTLRMHQTEFRDHELVKTRRGGDGQDCLYIPLPSDAISQLLADMDSA